MSPPEHYVEEAELYFRHLSEARGGPPATLLELGSGGGHLASHLKSRCVLTLVDKAPGMLDVNRALNPESEHVLADMRTVRLDRVFDAVLVHDAVMYMTTPEDLRRVMETAFVHCGSGGAVLFVPDCVAETFRTGTSFGGTDGEGRAMRYVEWTIDPDPTDTTYQVDYVYLLREGNGDLQIERDTHIEGLFRRADWLTWLSAAGFEARVLSEPDAGDDVAADCFVGVRPEPTGGNG